jgi:hypothetical protein
MEKLLISELSKSLLLEFFCFTIFVLVQNTLRHIILYFIVFLISSTSLFTQSVDHWEMLVLNTDIWHYQTGNGNIPVEWKDPSFDIGQWQEGPGGIGYGDNDDNTLISNNLSVFIRTEFDIIDLDNIETSLLHADYDDGFVAYLNGVEIARNNLGSPGITTPYYATATTGHEASLFQGGVPETYNILDLSLLQNGRNVLAVQVHNTSPSSTDLSSNFFLSAGINDNSNDYKTTPSWFQRVVFQSSLPLLKITTENNAEILDDPKIDAHLGVINNGQNQTNNQFDPFTDYNGKIGIEIRGTSSQLYDKKGYAIETRNADDSNNNVELLGMPIENDWVLHGPYSDKSLLRNVLTYHLGNLTEQYAPRTRFCEVFINEEYQGIYVLTESIKQDKNRVDIAKLTEDENSGDDLTGGYIIKVDRNPNNIPGKGWYSTFPDYKYFAYVEPKANDITDTQRTYIQQYMYFFELAMNKPDYQETFKNYIDLESWVDYFLVTEISKHIDAYKLSFYMYKDKASKGGKLHMGPLWDINLGYGNFDFECSPNPQGWAYEFPLCGSWHPFWARKIADIPNLQHLTNCRWQELRAGPFQTDSLLLYIDEQVSYLGESVNRNFERWPTLGTYVWPNNFIGQTYEEELNFLKNWLLDRLEWMDNNMIGDCDLYTNTGEPTTQTKLTIYPNPANDIINIEHLIRTGEKAIVEILDIHSRLVKVEEITQSSQLISINDLSEGLYLLVLKEKGVIKERNTFIKYSEN